MPHVDLALVPLVADRLAAARSVLFITGAGVSADSGLPTYRGIGGLYERELTDDGIPIEEALSGGMFQRRPELTWKYLAEIERACRGARPNRAHEVIAALESRFERAWVLTQNVDGLHGDAGSRRLIEVHGRLRNLLCTWHGHRRSMTSFAGLAIPPRCPECGALERPDVVLFGEYLAPATTETMERELGRGFDVVFSIGTTSVFPYIASPVHAARASGGFTVEINPGDSDVSAIVDVRLRVGAAEAMDAIARAVERTSLGAG